MVYILILLLALALQIALLILENQRPQINVLGIVLQDLTIFYYKIIAFKIVLSTTMQTPLLIYVLKWIFPAHNNIVLTRCNISAKRCQFPAHSWLDNQEITFALKPIKQLE